MHYMQGQDDELLLPSRGRRALTFVSGTAGGSGCVGEAVGKESAAGVLTLSGAAFEWALTTSAESMKPMASKCP
ncbi:unnamed protein product [Sphagnum compactum]